MKLADLHHLLLTKYGLEGGTVTVTERHQTFGGRSVLRVKRTDTDVAVKIDATGSPHSPTCTSAQQHVNRIDPRLAARVLSTVQGDLCAYVGDEHVTVHEWLPGHHPSHGPPTWSRLGDLTAELHEIEPCPVPFAIPVPAAAEEIDVLAGELGFDELHGVADRVRNLPPGPSATVHGELGLSNVIEATDGRLTPIDWDQAGTGPCAIDLGYPLIHVLTDRHGRCDWNGAGAFYTAYRNRRRLPVPGDIFTAALLHAARYLPYADTDVRCDRLRASLAAEDSFVRFIRDV